MRLFSDVMFAGRQRRKMPVATTTTATTETHEDNGLCQDDIGSPRFCSGGRPLPRNRPELEHSLGRAARWSAAVRPSPLLYLLLATAIASCQATSRNGGSSSNYLSTNNNNHVRDYGESASRGGVVASSTLCPPKCKCLPNKQVSSTLPAVDSAARVNTAPPNSCHLHAVNAARVLSGGWLISVDVSGPARCPLAIHGGLR